MAADLSDERAFWEKRAAAWERRIEALNLFSDDYGVPAMDALGVRAGDRVVDIGCGPGTTAVELARRVGPAGEVVALDISEAMIDAARRRAGRAEATNLRCVVHDLEAGPIEESFDAAFSRFGVMFFSAPERAFANIARSLRPGGRFSCCVWGPVGDNPWMFVPTLASAGVLGANLTLPGPGEPGPFSLADPDRFESLLANAGFNNIVVTPVNSSRVITTAHANDEVRTLLEVGPVGEAFEGADEATRQRAIDSVIDAIEPFRDGEGWRLAGSAIVVSATSNA